MRLWLLLAVTVAAASGTVAAIILGRPVTAALFIVLTWLPGRLLRPRRRGVVGERAHTEAVTLRLLRQLATDGIVFVDDELGAVVIDGAAYGVSRDDLEAFRRWLRAAR